MKKWLINKLLNGDRDLLARVTIENTSFVKTLDVEQFEQDSEELWSSMAHNFKGLKKWIEDRKALLLRQNLIESNDKNGLKAILNEWTLVEGFISTPVEIPEFTQTIDTDPELKTQDRIMDAFKSSRKTEGVV